MKRSAIISAVLMLAVLLSVLPISAAENSESYALIFEDAEWTYTESYGARVNIDFSSGNAVFSGSLGGTWPAAQCDYAVEDLVRVNIAEYSLSYDFTVEGGNTNISFRFINDEGVMMSFPISNSCLGDVSYDSGSGDLRDGNYKGVIQLIDFVNAKKFYKDEPFDISYISADNKLTFSGIQVYSVNGAVITVRDLSVVKNSPAGEFIKGDVNGNGDIDANDYALAKRYVLGTFNLNDEQIKRGDINGNNEVDANDYALIKRHVLGTYTIK